MKDLYKDIIDLPHHVSSCRPRMSVRDRAAQFAPFSALTGYDDTVSEVARETEKKISLDEYAVEAINKELRYASDNIKQRPVASVTYFLSDKRKSGGKYLHTCGIIVSVDEYEGAVEFEDGTRICFDNIISLIVNKDINEYE